MRLCFRWVIAATVVAVAGFAPVSFAQPVPPPVATGAGNLTLKLQPVAKIPSGDGTPSDFATANDGTGRRFVSTLTGKIDIINANGTIAPFPFLNLGSGGANLPVFVQGEGGFLGLAFSPQYKTNGKFYTFTTETFDTTTPADFSNDELYPTKTNKANNPSNQTVIREWSVDSSNPNAALTTSRVVLRLNHPNKTNHQGGALKFGSDGYLYLGLGDGGGANDFSNAGGGPDSATNPNDGHNNATGNAQDTSLKAIDGHPETQNGNAFGKILRIDPRDPATTTGSLDATSYNKQYRVPASNPFAGSSTNMNEIYAFGLRNPYRFSFDSITSKLYVGDVGQDNREEVDTITNGGNYGWPYIEGTRDNQLANGSQRSAPGGFTSAAPIGEYAHTDGKAIVGGFVYRGSIFPALYGKYVFGDYQGPTGIDILGRLFYMDPNSAGAQKQISEFNYDLSGYTPDGGLLGFGEDSNHELYALFTSGQVVMLVPEPTGLILLGILPLLGLRKRRAVQIH